ncbi:MAG: thiolase family protein [Bacteroidetes bacterium]|nr:thiolase family protein [Bacteroidota bacterium]MBL6963194.1 thiolase family protein [Bacteroidota bacterium]
MNKQKEVVIVSAARSPIGKHGGYYNDLPAEDLAVLAVKEAIDRSGIDLGKTRINGVIAGMIYIDSQNQQIYLPRNVSVRVAEMFNDTDNLRIAPGKTTLRICGTGFQVLADAFDLISTDHANQADCILSFATENMSRTNLIHHGRRKKDSVWDFEDSPLTDYLLEGFNHNLFKTLMPKTADVYGAQVGITRKDCDEFAYLSHSRAIEAQSKQWNRFSNSSKNDYLKGVFVLDTIDQAGNVIRVWRDEGTKYDINMDELGKLRPLLGPKGLVTPGTASQISDGAAASILMSREYADKNNIPYLAVIKGYQFSTVPPEIMGQGPVPAVRDLLAKMNMKQSEIDLFEVNEAFAAQYLGVEKELGLPRDITNVNGGAIALGHNIAATGLRITTDLVYELKRRKAKTGIASACIGGGQGGAVCVEIV